MGYTKNGIIADLEKINIEDIYIQKMVNYSGKTTDTKEKYTEVIAEEILNNPTKYDFTKIKMIDRKITYKTETHNGKYNPNSNRREEIIALKMFKKNYNDLGKIIDYQIPLKDAKTTKVGKIDIISYKDNTLYLIELKNDRSKESLLRCVLEIITYYNQINKDKLLEDYGLSKTTKVKPAILIFKDTKPYTAINDEYVNKLIKKYDIDLFIGEVEEQFNIEKVKK